MTKLKEKVNERRIVIKRKTTNSIPTSCKIVAYYKRDRAFISVVIYLESEKLWLHRSSWKTTNFEIYFCVFLMVECISNLKVWTYTSISLLVVNVSKQSSTCSCFYITLFDKLQFNIWSKFSCTYWSVNLFIYFSI